MEKQTISLGAPLVVGAVTVVPVVQTSARHWQTGGAASFLGLKQPVSLIVITPTGTAAFAITGEALSLQKLVAEVPGIKEFLAP